MIKIFDFLIPHDLDIDVKNLLNISQMEEKSVACNVIMEAPLSTQLVLGSRRLDNIYGIFGVLSLVFECTLQLFSSKLLRGQRIGRYQSHS